MTVAQQIHIETVKLVGNNVVSVWGGNVGGFFQIKFTALEFALKSQKIWNQAGAGTSINNETATLNIVMHR